jgi:hypothetical protein
MKLLMVNVGYARACIARSIAMFPDASILCVVNEAPKNIRSVLEMSPEAAANSRIVEGKLSIPYGLWPVEITNEEGKPEKVLQRLDKGVASRLVAAFNSLRGRLSRVVSGCQVYMGHPDHAGAKERAAWKRLALCTGLEAAENSLVAICDMPDETKSLVAANAALAPSPYWGLRRTQEKQGDLTICEPVCVYSFGLTPRPNIAGSAVNEDPAPDAEVMDMQEESDRDQSLAVLAADIADLESRLQAAELARATREQEILSRDSTITELRTQCECLRTELEAARAQVQAQVECCNSVTGQREASVGAVVDAAIKAERIVAKDRDHWVKKLQETPAAVNELFVNPLKLTSTVPAERIAAANSDVGSVPASARFEQIVRARMAGTHEDWATAWNACKDSHHEIYKLMPNGGRG